MAVLLKNIFFYLELLTFHILNGYIVALRCVPEFAGCETSQNFTTQQTFLLLNLLQNTFVLVGSSRQVWQHLVDGTVGDVFVSGITRLTCNLELLELCDTNTQTRVPNCFVFISVWCKSLNWQTIFA